MVDPTPLSPLLRDLCAKVAPIEARLAILDAEIATREQERDGLRSTLAGICRALDPEQVTLPLPGLGAPPAEKPRPRRITAKGEELLRAAIANDRHVVTIPRSVATRGAVIAADHLAGLDVPLLRAAGTQIDGARLYQLTDDGEIIARAMVPAGVECRAPGPRGLLCRRPFGHVEAHQGIADDEEGQPPMPCEVCGAGAGVHCADPKACEQARRAS